MPPLPDYIANWQPREFGALPMDAEARLDGDEPRPRIRTTAFFGGHTGTRRARCVEFPTDTELSEMSWGEVEALHFPRIDWLARGGLDALRFYRSDGVVSDFYGASPANERREKPWGYAGDLRFAMDTAKLGDADVRAIDVWWYRHDVAGLAFVGFHEIIVAVCDQRGSSCCGNKRRNHRSRVENLHRHRANRECCHPHDAGVAQSPRIGPHPGARGPAACGAVLRSALSFQSV